MSIIIHANVSVNIIENTTPSANFGVPLLLAEHTVTANRQDGLFASINDLESAGFTVAATPSIRTWATRFFAQRPRASAFRIGRRLASEHIATSLDAVEAAGAANWYATNILTNTADEILGAAAWHETRPKIAILQSSSSLIPSGGASAPQVTDLVFGGTAADNDYVVAVRNAWTNEVIGTVTTTRTAGVPATNADLATQFRLDWDAVPELASISAPAAGASETVEITFTDAGASYTFDITTPDPGATLVETTAAFDQNPLLIGQAGGYNRSAVWYHANDADYVDGGVTSRCLGFNLDAPNGKGSWAHHNLTGLTADPLSLAQKEAIDNAGGNWYSPVPFTSGTQDPGITFPGQMLSGRFIDVQTTLDLTQSRMEEALFRVWTQAAQSTSPEVPFTDQGIARFADAALEVFARLIRAGHYREQFESAITGRVTPYVDAPRVSTISAAQRQERRISIEAEAVLRGSILSVGNATTVGFNINVSF